MTLLNNKKASDIAKSQWIDELSEEEEKVLSRGAKIDNYLKTHKNLKINIK